MNPGIPRGRVSVIIDVHCNEGLTVREHRGLRERDGTETYYLGTCADMHFSFSRLILPLSVKLGVDRTGFVKRRCELILN
jgi:hypothetical protein